MTQMTDTLATADDVVSIAERASLYELLQAALRRQRRPQQLPNRLYEDLGLPPGEQPNFGPLGH